MDTDMYFNVTCKISRIAIDAWAQFNNDIKL